MIEIEKVPALTGNARLWWEHLDKSKQLDILNKDDPLEAILLALSHEFLGIIPSDESHYDKLFMSEILCDLDLLIEYYCIMQGLYYKIPDHENVAYL